MHVSAFGGGEIMKHPTSSGKMERGCHSLNSIVDVHDPLSITAPRAPHHHHALQACLATTTRYSDAPDQMVVLKNTEL